MFITEYKTIILDSTRLKNNWNRKFNTTFNLNDKVLAHWTQLSKIRKFERTKFEIKCDECNKKFERDTRSLNNHICKSCAKLGKRNPMYGQSNNPGLQKMKELISSPDYINPFARKEVIKKLKDKNHYQQHALNRWQDESYQKIMKSVREKNANSLDVKKKLSAASLKNWQDPEFAKRVLTTKLLEYKGVKYQSSYELIFLKFMEKQNLLKHIKRAPIVQYKFNGKNHKYFPDFMLDGTNILFEIKSSYWWYVHEEQNKAKINACFEQGYDIKLVLDNDFTVL